MRKIFVILCLSVLQLVILEILEKLQLMPELCLTSPFFKVFIFLVDSEKAMAPHSSTLAWTIPWTEEPGRLQSMGLLRVRHDWATSLWHIGEGNGNPLQCYCLENPRDGGAWWAAVCGFAQSQTRLQWLSSSNWWYVPIHFNLLLICLKNILFFSVERS